MTGFNTTYVYNVKQVFTLTRNGKGNEIVGDNRTKNAWSNAKQQQHSVSKSCAVLSHSESDIIKLYINQEIHEQTDFDKTSKTCKIEGEEDNVVEVLHTTTQGSA